jgi:hypothetical protein
MKVKADWLAWSLHYGFGILLGSVGGVASLARGRYYGGGLWMDGDLVAFYVTGAALAVAGLTSYYGDRLWFGGIFRVIPPDGIRQDGWTLMVSLMSGTLGILAVAGCLLKHFQLF